MPEAKRMDVKDEILQIKEVLKKHPRGINVIDIAREVNMNRQTVTKYLDMLVVSGNVDVKMFGPSKVYYMSQRLPVSSMLSLSSDFILLLDKNLNVVNVNEPFLEFTRSKRDNIIGKGIDAIRFPLQFDPPITPFITDALEGKECRFEANYKKQGSDLCYGIKFIPLVFDDGQPGACVMFENITDRKKAEEALMESESQLKRTERILFRSQEAGRVGSWHLDLLKNELWWSPETYRMFGFPPDKKLGYEDFLSIIHEEDKYKVDQAWNNALAGGPYDIEHRIVVNGQIMWMHEKAVLDFDDKGAPIYGIGTVADITERKLAEEALRKSAYQMARAQQIAHVGSWEVDVKTNRVAGSRELFEIWELDPESYTMDTFIGKIHPDDRQRNDDKINAAIHEHKPYDEEFRLLTDHGERIIRSTGKTIYDEAGQPVTFFGIVQDITERKRTENELRENQEELAVQAEELESQVEELRAKNEELEIQITERVRAETALVENEKKLKALFDLLPVGVSILNMERNVVMANVALEKILGIDKGGFSHRVYEKRKYYRADGSEMLAAEFPSHLALRDNRDVENIEIRIAKEDGSTVWTNVSAVRMPFKDWALALTTSDISMLKRAEERQENLIRQLKESNEQLSAIKKVAESAMSTLDLDALLASIQNRIMEVMNADAIIILLREGDLVRVRASIGIDKEDISRFSVPIGTGFAGKIAGSGEPQYIEDAQLDTQIASSALKEAGIRSIMGVPIRHRGEIIGVLHVEWKEIHPFSRREQDFLQTLADTCSASILNAKLYEKTRNSS